ELARRAAATVAADVIEWGALGGAVSLLQIGPAAPPEVAARGPTAPRSSESPLPPDAERLGRLVTAFPGPVADELVLPWALGDRAGSGSSAGVGDETPPIPAGDPASALREARGLAADLIAGVWGTSPDAARDRAAAVSGLLLEGLVEEGIEAIAGLSEPEPAAALRVVELVRTVGEHLARAGILPSAVLVWRLSGSELDRAIEGVRPVLRSGPGRWEPFVVGVVSSRGRRIQGLPVAPGVGAGPTRRIHGLRAIGRPGPREVLVTPRPLPHLAPLLWHSAGLVTAGGTSGAHLFEVARSLGVPAVVGIDLDALGAADSLVAVDGDTGVVSVLPGPPPAGASAPQPGDGRSRAMV
ncbi:MAG: PEP-utilizing enzyme, partial [Actinomycetota bacterium]